MNFQTVQKSFNLLKQPNRRPEKLRKPTEPIQFNFRTKHAHCCTNKNKITHTLAGIYVRIYLLCHGSLHTAISLRLWPSHPHKQCTLQFRNDHAGALEMCERYDACCSLLIAWLVHGSLYRFYEEANRFFFWFCDLRIGIMTA